MKFTLLIFRGLGLNIVGVFGIAFLALCGFAFIAPLLPDFFAPADRLALAGALPVIAVFMLPALVRSIKRRRTYVGR